MVDKSIRSGDKSIDAYIESLEAYVEKDKASHIKRLINACNEVAGTIADDVMILKDNGNDEEIDNKLQMLGSKKNKIYERFLSLIGQMKNFKTLSDLADDMNDKEDKNKPAVVSESKPVKRKTNIQDFIQPT